MRNVGTRFTTGCGHSWKRRYPQWTVDDLKGATTDCIVCGALCLIDSRQFEGKDSNPFPSQVHMSLFHKWIHAQDKRWPEDGAGAFSVAWSD